MKINLVMVCFSTALHCPMTARCDSARCDSWSVAMQNEEVLLSERGWRQEGEREKERKGEEREGEIGRGERERGREGGRERETTCYLFLWSRIFGHCITFAFLAANAGASLLFTASRSLNERVRVNTGAQYRIDGVI